MCPNLCNQINDSVCATDGKTYPNLCEIDVADCHRKENDPMAPEIKLESFGPCPTGTLGKNMFVLFYYILFYCLILIFDSFV